MPKNSPIVVALDYQSSDQALLMARQLDPTRCRLKVGKELFTSAGPQIVDQLQHYGFEIFLRNQSIVPPFYLLQAKRVFLMNFERSFNKNLLSVGEIVHFNRFENIGLLFSFKGSSRIN
mgnify:CR=1 FL=1